MLIIQTSVKYTLRMAQVSFSNDLEIPSSAIGRIKGYLIISQTVQMSLNYQPMVDDCFLLKYNTFFILPMLETCTRDFSTLLDYSVDLPSSNYSNSNISLLISICF